MNVVESGEFSDEVFTSGDDHQLLKWNVVSGEATVLATLPVSLFPTNIHCYPRGLTTGATKGASSSIANDIFVLAAADGLFSLLPSYQSYVMSISNIP